LGRIEHGLRALEETLPIQKGLVKGYAKYRRLEGIKDLIPSGPFLDWRSRTSPNGVTDAAAVVESQESQCKRGLEVGLCAYRPSPNDAWGTPPYF
jgi:hypothetical protein